MPKSLILKVKMNTRKFFSYAWNFAENFVYKKWVHSIGDEISINTFISEAEYRVVNCIGLKLLEVANVLVLP